MIEPADEAFDGRLDPEQHRDRTPGAVIARVMRRVLVLTAPMWRTHHTACPSVTDCVRPPITHPVELIVQYGGWS
jgi:hypothetical protein